ncbi:MAG: dTMP kinase [Thermoguttaceae bacterium]
MFFSFDGTDGVGKSTQMERFCDALRTRGHDVVTCRDPGSTPLGESVRQILLGSGPNTPIGRRSEMLLYMAARAQLVEEIILPALTAGKIVVSDRFLLANIVYQGHAGGLDIAEIRQIGNVATTGAEPDLTFLLDMTAEAAGARISRQLDRMEQQGDEFRQQLRTGFLAEARRDPDRIVVIDADQSVEAVHAEILAAAEKVLSAT